ncbi:hypothetical protein PsYK624_086170 [Phanerochaete sordida]|uniref:DUF6589 domain-containing protein n=1 Tax=Phanerochaete sordida TaxID=48140 RepID=A0A9P3GAI8_9APHY|nr:hypothetical protein PsYK624_086170 [Phanerochaete sordida]
MYGQLNFRDQFRNVTSASFQSPLPAPPDPDEPPDEPFAVTETRVDQVLKAIKKAKYASFGDFLMDAFGNPGSGTARRSKNHAQVISSFLGGRSNAKAEKFVDLLYRHKDSHPRANHLTPASKMAQQKIWEWAVDVVASRVDREARQLVDKRGGLRLLESLTWDTVRSFSLDSMLTVIKDTAPTTVRMLSSIAIPVHKPQERTEQPAARAVPTAMPPPPPGSPPHGPAQAAAEEGVGPEENIRGPAPAGKGKNRRNPWAIIVVSLLMLLNARNLQFTAFQKLIGVWLFANGAAVEIFAILCRLGLSAAYTTTLHVLQDLTDSAKKTVQHYAAARAVMVVYDNINRMRRVWDPDLGQKGTMDSGTAATLIILDACEDPIKAFDLEALRRAKEERHREKLDLERLRTRVDWQRVLDISAAHTAIFLVQEVAQIAHLQDELNTRLRTTLAIRRMKKGRRTTVLPLGTSSHEENSAQGNRDVLNDIVLGQLGLTKEKASELLMLIGGDQATVEKVRTLKRLLAHCPHGYDAYEWVLPIIQLWHMGWSDLERILSTHWGTDITDISTLAFMNEHLGRNVKNVKRPDFYPAQALVFDTLRSDVVSCWREHLKADDLQAYFSSRSVPSVDDLLKHASEIVAKYMSTEGYEIALNGENEDGYFPVGSDWPKPLDDPSSAPSGDHVLANTILRMRDCILHFEFQSAVADGDIGRVMNIIGIWVFTFCGSGRSKYTNELLELICSFEYEFSDELAAVVLDHWLCNLTGYDGCWFPLDLLQEHGNRQLKKLTNDRAAPFGSAHFKNIISYNIRYLLDVKDSLRDTLGLSSRSGSHKRKKKMVAMRRVSALMRERELHRFRQGRSLSPLAQDDFENGYRIFARTTRLRDFTTRTALDSVHVHDGGNDVEMEDGTGTETAEGDVNDDDEAAAPPMPNMWLDGRLVQDEDDSGSDDEGDEDEEV